jgi:hypothetical protein
MIITTNGIHSDINDIKHTMDRDSACHFVQKKERKKSPFGYRNKFPVSFPREALVILVSSSIWK